MPDAGGIGLYGKLREIDRRFGVCSISISTFVLANMKTRTSVPRVGRQRLLHRKSCDHVKAGAADVKFQLSLPQYLRGKQE